MNKIYIYMFRNKYNNTEEAEMKYLRSGWGVFQILRVEFWAPPVEYAMAVFTEDYLEWRNQAVFTSGVTRLYLPCLI